jgi:hypothetical protein
MHKNRKKMKIDKIRIEKIKTWNKHKQQQKSKNAKTIKKEWKQMKQGKGKTVKKNLKNFFYKNEETK